MNGLELLQTEFGVIVGQAPKRDERSKCGNRRCSGRLIRCIKIAEHIREDLRIDWQTGSILECDRCGTHIRHRTVAQVEYDRRKADEA